MKSYDHKKIEKKWQEFWAKNAIYTTPDTAPGKDNFYLLVEFPYPSGNLHVGHWYAFALPDILARKLRMSGKNVLYPIGFDAFGLPAENAAIKNKLNPRQWTEQNIAYMSKQIESMGASFDWSREVITCDPAYYTWTQWLFLQLFKKGLAYQKETMVNWCPVDKTVLANEQVIDGKCERCGNEVVQKEMLQWNIKITEYADRLVDDLEPLEWPEQIKESQRNWIGRSEGAQIDFYLDFGDEAVNARTGSDGKKAHITVFTTRPDTLFGATYLVLAPEHLWVTLALQHKTVLTNNDEVASYVDQAMRKNELERQTDQKEKTGVELKGVHAINPATGEKIPMFVADYVLGTYGTGAIMAVPAHDERDREFADRVASAELGRHPGLKYVIKPNSEEDFIEDFFPDEFHRIEDGQTVQQAQARDHMQWYQDYLTYSSNNNWKGHWRGYTGTGTLINSGEFDGMISEDAKKAITKKFGRPKTTYRLRDWIVSRQRYWGVPIPVIHCAKCGPVAVPDDQLPVLLPETDDYLPEGSGKSPLAKVKSFVEVSCPQCGEKAQRETDTLDTFVDSSWYFLRYTDPNNTQEFAAQAKQANWMPVDLYSGGAEHTTMHLLYSRFWHKALFDLGLVADPEPYLRRMNRGIILGPDGQKMSKSKGNVIDPDDVVERLGADTMRMYLAFIGPYNEVASYPWNPDGVVGVRKFLERVWRLSGVLKEEGSDATERLLHKTIKKVGEDIVAMKYNTAISAMMVFVNSAEKDAISKNQFERFLMILAPFAPHIAEELWHEIGREGSIHQETWPSFDEKMLQDTEVTIAIQIDGKARGEVKVAANASKEELEKAAREVVASRLEGVEIVRTVVVPNRLVNFVTAS
ncbi:MAG TPA: class I tRNA ligase family protein [Candidatus Paceibacterota bacterium]|nr:class I tRNA ligase family protein [Candidatus Paceibacterota bacterium]